MQTHRLHIFKSHFPRPVQRLDLVNAVPHIVEQLVEAVLLYDLPRSVEDEPRVGAHVVVDIDGDDVGVVQTCAHGA